MFEQIFHSAALYPQSVEDSLQTNSVTRISWVIQNMAHLLPMVVAYFLFDLTSFSSLGGP